MKRYNIITSILLMTLGLYVFFESCKFPQASIASTLGPSFYPQLLSVLLVLLNLLLLIKSIRNKKDIQIKMINSKIIIGIIAIAIYCVLFEILGFIISSILLTGLLIKVLGCRKIKTLFSVSIALPVIIYFIFSKLLLVTLPLGILECFLN